MQQHLHDLLVSAYLLMAQTVRLPNLDVNSMHVTRANKHYNNNLFVLCILSRIHHYLNLVSDFPRLHPAIIILNRALQYSISPDNHGAPKPSTLR